MHQQSTKSPRFRRPSIQSEIIVASLFAEANEAAAVMKGDELSPDGKAPGYFASKEAKYAFAYRTIQRYYERLAEEGDAETSPSSPSC